MSHCAIAAALARDDITGGERLVAFSLASFADRRGLAWPGAPAAAARAGLGHSRYLQARDLLVRRGLAAVSEPATGRGRSSTVELTFALEGPWWEGEINAELFEAVLGHSRARGPARLLLAAMAAVADGEGVVSGLSTEELSGLAGVADRTYRRARAALLASGELELLGATGGRGNTNRWRVVDPRALVNGVPRAAPVAPRRMAPPEGARPLVAAVSPDREGDVNRPILTGVSTVNGGHDRTLSPANRPILTGVSVTKGGHDRTLFPETPAQTPAQTPAPNARAGREPQNPRTRKDPPTPLEGGITSGSVLVEEAFVTERGRRRRRSVPVDLADVRRRLGLPSPDDRADWQRIRDALADAAGETTFSIWLEPAELVAVDRDGVLVVAVPAQTLSWFRARFWRLVSDRAGRAGRQVRLADELERTALGAG